jgi:hypothetical protein
VFVTDRERLTAKIGQEGYDRCTAMISDGGGRLLEIANRESPFAEIANKGRDMEGVVIVGDYDVVPALTYDVLPADVRGHVSAQSDPDQFIVWSDQRYGDLDGDQLADVPVSRVPDCSSASFLLRGLSAADKRASSAKFGSRNARRPFAEGVFRNVPGSGAILVSGPQDHLDPRVSQPAGSRLYFMLHGSDSDATRYWGEDDEGMVEAFNLANLSPETAAAGATVLAGCCWGALAVRQLASRTSNHWNVTPHTPQSSIALRLIELGALAFVGCTGAHYSPLDGDLKFFGEPMHRAFWQSYAAGIAPAKALFEAKRAYIRDMPHGRQTMPEWAIEYKVLRQFTCLGLGW